MTGSMRAHILRTQGVQRPEPTRPGSCAKCPYWEEAPTGGIGVCTRESTITTEGLPHVYVEWSYPTDGEGCEVVA